MKRIFSPAAVLAFLLLLPGCAELVQIGTTLGKETGILSDQEEEELEQARRAEHECRPAHD